MNLHIAFTGTQAGMSWRQKAALHALLVAWLQAGWNITLHHGDCIGADAEAHDIVMSLGIRIVIHPASGVGAKRAFKSGAAFIHELLPPLVRNKMAVRACEVVVGAPRTDEEELRSGTWSTIRYARGLLPTRVREVHVLPR